MEYFRLGKLVASFGLKGELILSHNLGKKSSLKGLQAVFTEDKKNSFLPWFIESARIKSDNEIYIKLETIDTKESAMRMTRKELWLPETEFKKYAAKSAPVSLLGYMIFDGKDQLGEILEIIEQPHQVLCRIEMQGREVLIPLHDETLDKVDHKNKKVVATLPEGLLDIYLG
ncbi:MAG: ribosome maturation factor RimM [Chitinophagaceae bacterium]